MARGAPPFFFFSFLTGLTLSQEQKFPRGRWRRHSLPSSLSSFSIFLRCFFADSGKVAEPIRRRLTSRFLRGRRFFFSLSSFSFFFFCVIFLNGRGLRFEGGIQGGEDVVGKGPRDGEGFFLFSSFTLSGERYGDAGM